MNLSAAFELHKIKTAIVNLDNTGMVINQFKAQVNKPGGLKQIIQTMIEQIDGGAAGPVMDLLGHDLFELIVRYDEKYIN